jgi:hypothetical protein
MNRIQLLFVIRTGRREGLESERRTAGRFGVPAQNCSRLSIGVAQVAGLLVRERIAFLRGVLSRNCACR